MTINYIIYYINVFFFFYMFLYAVVFFDNHIGLSELG